MSKFLSIFLRIVHKFTRTVGNPVRKPTTQSTGRPVSYSLSN